MTKARRMPAVDGDLEIHLQPLTRTLCQRRRADRMDRAAHDGVDSDFDLDGALPHQQLGLAGIRRSWRMGLEALFLQTLDGMAEGFVDSPERLLARQGVGGKHQIEID
jgi:hypothetical protein